MFVKSFLHMTLIELNRILTSIGNISTYLVDGRNDGSGCSSQRQKPASLGFSDRKTGGRIL